MTIDEVSQFYHIPIEILHQYESLGLFKTTKKVIGVWQYDDEDLECLSRIMTLWEIGFNQEEIEIYMGLTVEGNKTKNQRIQMLNQKRDDVLDELHLHEKQLHRLDYLRYEVEKLET